MTWVEIVQKRAVLPLSAMAVVSRGMRGDLHERKIDKKSNQYHLEER